MKCIVSLLLIGFLLTSCTQEQPLNNKACNLDRDCVPATCCHPTTAVNTESAPACSGIMCTDECVPATIDCGQGEIKCVHNACTAVLLP